MSNIETFPLFGLVELTYFHDYLERIEGVLNELVVAFFHFLSGSVNNFG